MIPIDPVRNEAAPFSPVDFGNPDFVKYAESFGAKGYFIQAAGDLLPTLTKALAEDEVSVIAGPVDYSENTKLTEKLEHLTEPAKHRCPDNPNNGKP